MDLMDMSLDELAEWRRSKGKKKRIPAPTKINLDKVKYPWEELTCMPEYVSLDSFVTFLLDDERRTYTQEEFKNLCFWAFKLSNTLTVSKEIADRIGLEEKHISKVLQVGIMTGARWEDMAYVRIGPNSYVKPTTPQQSAFLKTWLEHRGFTMMDQKKKIGSSKVKFSPKSIPMKDHGKRYMGDTGPVREKGNDIYILPGDVAMCGRFPARVQGLGELTYKPVPKSTTVYRYSGSATMNWDSPEPKKKEK